jgi:hypothetical protein
VINTVPRTTGHRLRRRVIRGAGVAGRLIDRSQSGHVDNPGPDRQFRLGQRHQLLHSR